MKNLKHWFSLLKKQSLSAYLLMEQEYTSLVRTEVEKVKRLVLLQQKILLLGMKITKTYSSLNKKTTKQQKNNEENVILHCPVRRRNDDWQL